MLTKENDVWMVAPYESAARHIATKAMISLGLDPDDFRTRDKIITGISAEVTNMLNQAEWRRVDYHDRR